MPGPWADRRHWPDQVAEALGPEGPVQQRLPGFRHRPQQQRMAARIAEALASKGALICEAGTGTGKTFAYLVPALLSGLKLLISTGTRNLQDQLFTRDIPQIREALGVPVQVALLKGRSNYLCRYRLDAALAAPDQCLPEQRQHLGLVRDWSRSTQLGDIAELPIPEGAPVWPLVTSTADNCLGQACPMFNDCHLLEARRRAQAAELVVVNHHLLCADLALRDEGFGELLPAADGIIVDEAHQLPDIAANFFGTSVSGRQLIELARDTETAYRKDAGDLPALPPACEALRSAAEDLQQALAQALGGEDRRGPWREIASEPGVERAADALQDALARLDQTLAPIAERSRTLEQCQARARDLDSRLQGLFTADEAPEPSRAQRNGEREDAAPAPLLAARPVRWLDIQGRGFRLHQTPLDVSDVLREHRTAHSAAWVFTSATLAVGRSFEHFASRVGCEEADTAQWSSPFDFARQALLYCPAEMPEPSAPAFAQRVAEVACEVIALSAGRAFVLFTSHRALRTAASWIRDRINYPLLIQGSAPRAALIEQFRSLGNAVLLGTSSFWEGVDVRGEALSCVIIDKLPFSAPSDPVLQARVDAMRAQGGNPFRDFQLPQAVITLKQGAGRLIRDPQDRGLLVICDPRLWQRGYGKVFLNSLPPMPRTSDWAELCRFFGAQDQDEAGPCTSASISS